MENVKTYPCVVTIATSDSSGGAGIQADIKAISATGSYAASIITALTAQNTCGVQSIYDIPPDFIMEQIHAVFSDMKVNAIKIGMLHNRETIRAVIAGISAHEEAPIVLDPVMVSKNGCILLAKDAISFLLEEMLPHVFLITPNLYEAEKILGDKIETEEAMAQAAKKMATQFNLNVLIKGGHLNGTKASDVLYEINTKNIHWFQGNRILTRHTHGTGCSLSAAIASFLAQNNTLCDAILHAKNYLAKAISSGSQYQLGEGCGPIDHFYYLRESQYVS